jgi:hypothetical protein
VLDAALFSLERLVEDDTLLKFGLELEPMFARLARAVEVLSRARAAKERRLRFCELLADCECCSRGASRLMLPKERSRVLELVPVAVAVLVEGD